MRDSHVTDGPAGIKVNIGTSKNKKYGEPLSSTIDAKLSRTSAAEGLRPQVY